MGPEPIPKRVQSYIYWIVNKGSLSNTSQNGTDRITGEKLVGPQCHKSLLPVQFGLTRLTKLIFGFEHCRQYIDQASTISLASFR